MSFTNEEESQNSKNKTKFCVKILQLLKETLLDRSKIVKIGLGWCEDGIHFICNSNILGNYINLKSNSINTNFRDHYFQIENVPLIEIKKYFGNLPEIKNWKVRKNASYPFTSSSTDLEVEKIPCTIKNKRSLNHSNVSNTSILPPITQEMLKTDQFQLRQVEILVRKLDFTSNWKIKFLTTISQDWFLLCQKNTEQINNFESIDVSQLIQTILETSEQNIDHSKELIEDNLHYLLKNSNCNSQSLSDVFFIDYLKLCLRYGFIKQIASNILILSSNITQSFVSWFVPSTDSNYAIDHMTNNNLKWCLKLSTTNPNFFTILTNFKYSVVKSSHIIFNPMPLLPDQSFFIKNENDSSIVSRSNLKSFITDVLSLEIPDDIIASIEKKSVTYVPISNILNQEKTDFDISDNFNDFESNLYGDMNFGVYK